MKKWIALGLCLILVIVILLSIVISKNQLIENYMLYYEMGESITILQLTDLHVNDEETMNTSKVYIEKTITEANPDLIVLTGDIFVYQGINVANKLAIIEKFVNYLDSFGLKWCYVFGNHDEESGVSKNQIGNIISKAQNSLFLNLNDFVYGSSNYVVNLTNDGNTIFSLYMFDSNSYRFYLKNFDIGYDYIHSSQIKWYQDAVAYNSINGQVIPSFAFFHIPLCEFLVVYNLYSEGLVEGNGENNEDCCAPNENSGLFAKMKELGSTKAIFVGHDHINNSNLLYEGIWLCYGVKSAPTSYYDIDMLGGQKIVINNDGSFEFSRIFVTV
ncbi:MAG: metallophosphoesterase family protein [Clostridia bacterium]